MCSNSLIQEGEPEKLGTLMSISNPITGTTMTANKLTSDIIEFLQSRKCQAERVNNISRQVKGRWVKSNMTRGTSDIHAIVKGSPAKWEG